ncbi:MAG TPA: nucleoside monophosphate kinase [Bryobacteraceae bacterium]|jgi:adenylate kinase|nr:nucleoside monophosphate kinase [Bryobacteraceae bacterium]
MSAVVVILFGSPGSGKGTQAKLLKRCLSGPHVSTGDMLRAHISLHDEIGAQSEGLIKSGKLVPDELVNRLVEERLARPDAKQHGAILDGYPRTQNQAAVLLELLKTGGYRAVVVHLVVDYERIVARLGGRRQCPVCGTLYSLTTNPPRVPGHCDREGAVLVTREDDRESVIRERLAEYDRQTVPVLNFFRDAAVPRIDVEAGDAAPEEIVERICGSLEQEGLIAPAKKSLVK